VSRQVWERRGVKCR